MTSQVVINEAVTVNTPHGIHISQTNKPQPTYQNLESLKKFLKEEVKVIAMIQIMCGFITFSLGTILASAAISPYFTWVYSVLLKSSYPFVGSLCFVMSGILSVITKTKSTKPLVHSSLALSIMSIPFALLGIIILFVNLISVNAAFQQCELSKQPKAHKPYHPPEDLVTDCLPAKVTLQGVIAVMLVCSALELGLAILSTLLWWKQVQSDISGNVIFQSQDSKNKPSTPAYEELLTP